MIVTTQNAKYRIEPEIRSWQILPDGKRRSYEQIRIEIGQPMELIWPPLTRTSEPRYIETSPVLSIEEEL